MKFQKRLVHIYTIFMFLMSLLVGFVFYHYSFDKQSQTTLKSLESSSARTLTSLMDTCNKMEYRTSTLLANPEILISLRKLSEPEKYSHFEIMQIKKDISNALIVDSVLADFYRILIFNQQYVTYAIQSNNSIPRAHFDLSNVPEIERANQAMGKPIITTAHKDNWGEKDQPYVFSLMRKVVGKNMGYIEVQELVSSLEKNIDKSNSFYKTLIFVNKNQYLYGDVSGINPSFYSQFLQKDAGFIKVNGAKYMVASSAEDTFGLKIVTFISYQDLIDSLHYLLILVLSMVVLFFVTATGFVVISSRIITRPIRQIRKIMEHTTSSSEGGNMINLDTDFDEMKALAVSYQDLLARLEMTQKKEKELMDLQSQAQFNLLQSQINPHFIYNILNVISARGYERNDESICEICGYLADMLRYSTDSETEYTTLQDELHYTHAYLQLQKSRYEHLFDFTIDVDPLLFTLRVPKIVLLQFVENSFNHGFKNKSENLQIEIRGRVKENGMILEIIDNGNGIPDDNLASLNLRLQQTKEKIEHQRNIPLKIGGMGIVNTYARLLIFNPDHLIFTLKNNEDHGFIVHIECSCNDKEVSDV